jgi:hypothetical protein
VTTDRHAPRWLVGADDHGLLVSAGAVLGMTDPLAVLR